MTDRICKHFGECGGCGFQDIPYPEQLRQKQNRLRSLVEEQKVSAVIQPIRAFSPFFYRNKMEFTFSQKEDRLICGMHSRNNKREVFHLQECRIFSEDIQYIIERVCVFGRERRYNAYDTYSHKGFLRHLIVRETKFTQETMIGIVTTREDTLDESAFVKLLMDLPIKKKVSSLYWVCNDSFGDAVTFQEKRLLEGKPYITEKIGPFYFRISIDSFFQVNAQGITALYERIRERASLSKESAVLDLFCGVGAIGMFLSEKARFVWGVELSPSAIEDAVMNARDNGVKNISFICGDARKFLADRALTGEIDLLVINPPRSGIAKKTIKRVIEIKAPYLIYSSCNPGTFVVDVKTFTENGYSINRLEPFDLFPHTPHFETVAFLSCNG